MEQVSSQLFSRLWNLHRTGGEGFEGFAATPAARWVHCPTVAVEMHPEGAANCAVPAGNNPLAVPAPPVAVAFVQQGLEPCSEQITRFWQLAHVTGAGLSVAVHS